MSGTKRAKDDAELTSAEREARSIARAQEFLSGTSVIEQQGLGTWYVLGGGTMDDDTAQGHFIRCGLRGDDSAEALAARMSQMGYVRLGPKFRCTGYEADQGNGLYMWSSPSVYGKLRDMRRKNRQTMDAMVRNHARQLQVGSNAEVSVIGRSGHVSRADAEQTLTQALREARG